MKHAFKKRMLQLKLGGASYMRKEVIASVNGLSADSVKRCCRFTEHLIVRTEKVGLRMC